MMTIVPQRALVVCESTRALCTGLVQNVLHKEAGTAAHLHDMRYVLMHITVEQNLAPQFQQDTP